MEEKKEIKQPKTVMLKPVNIGWLKRQAHAESSPEVRVSDSQILDRLVDEARLKSESESPSPSKQKKSAIALEPVTAY